MSWKSDGKSPPSTHQQSPSNKRIYPATNGITIPNNLTTLQIKSKFDAEFRRFSLPIAANQIPTYSEFRSLVEGLHSLQNIPFTLCYTSSAGDLLPITNDENFRKAFESARPTLRLLIQRKGESWEEKYGYGTDTIDRRRKGLSTMLMPSNVKTPKRNYSISNPEDFRQVSAIIDVDIIPEAHRRVRLCKHGSDKPLGFYIRDGTSVRVTQGGVMKVQGIFISRLVEGGLAESTGLLAVNDEVLEVNGIEVSGKTLDQVTDMMVANAQNLIITVKPANQRNTLQRGANSRISGNSDWSEGARSSMYGGIGGGVGGGGGDSDDDKDEVTDLLQQPQPPPRHHHHAPSTRTTHFNKQGFP